MTLPRDLRVTAERLAMSSTSSADQAIGRVMLAVLDGERPEDALGLPPQWRQTLRHAERDDLLRRLAESLPGSTRAKAVALQAELRSYAATSWPRERFTERLPESSSPRRQLLHRLFRLDDNPPASLRRLIDILGCAI